MVHQWPTHSQLFGTQSQKQNSRAGQHDITYMGNLKNTNESYGYQTNLWLPKGKGRGEYRIKNIGLRINRYKLLSTKEISKNILTVPCVTAQGTIFSSFVITYDEKEYIYIYIYSDSFGPLVIIYMYLNHFVVHLKLTQYCKSTTELREKAWCTLSLSHVWLFATLWTGSSVHGDSPGKNTGVGCLALLQGIFSTQRSHSGLPHCRWIHNHLSHQGSPRMHIWKKKYIFIQIGSSGWFYRVIIALKYFFEKFYIRITTLNINQLI